MAALNTTYPVVKQAMFMGLIADESTRPPAAIYAVELEEAA